MNDVRKIEFLFPIILNSILNLGIESSYYRIINFSSKYCYRYLSNMCFNKSHES